VAAAISAGEARKTLLPLIERVIEDHTPIEIVSKRANAVLVSKDDWDLATTTSAASPEDRVRGEPHRLFPAATPPE
jgi:prevent-host-death family protein